MLLPRLHYLQGQSGAARLRAVVRISVHTATGLRYPRLAMKTATRYLARRMRISDIPQVLEIERESFPAMWPPTAFRRELQQNRLAHYIVVSERNYIAEHDGDDDEPGTIGRILGEIRHILSGEDDELPPPEGRPELIVGFVGVWMMPDEAHIVTIATRESHRRQGIGEMLLQEAIELAREKAQPLITLEVRVSNEPAIALYRKYGFEEAGLRPRYYSDNREDAYILTAASVTSDHYAELLARLRSEHRRRFGDFDTLT
jgi:ribosomal-protein-alanine N-acetyltransferase